MGLYSLVPDVWSYASLKSIYLSAAKDQTSGARLGFIYTLLDVDMIEYTCGGRRLLSTLFRPTELLNFLTVCAISQVLMHKGNQTKKIKQRRENEYIYRKLVFVPTPTLSISAQLYS